MFDHHESIKNVADVTAGVIGIAALLQWLPALAAGLTIIWTLIRIFDWAEKRFFKK